METQNLAKWISELQAQIDQVKRIAQAAGGDTVTITPALDSGTKVADYAIGDTEGSLYAPTPTPYTPVGYSTDEQETGMTWIDGSPIYQKTYHLGYVDATTKRVSVAHGLSDANRFVDLKAMAGYTTNNIWVPLSYANTALNAQGNCYVDGANIAAWVSFSDGTDYDIYATVYYTKTPPSPEPENNTKKRRK